MERFEYYDRSEHSTYPVLRITPKGMKWLLANKANLNLQIAAKETAGSWSYRGRYPILISNGITRGSRGPLACLRNMGE